jgi:hypothetical protein
MAERARRVPATVPLSHSPKGGGSTATEEPGGGLVPANAARSASTLIQMSFKPPYLPALSGRQGLFPNSAPPLGEQYAGGQGLFPHSTSSLGEQLRGNERTVCTVVWDNESAEISASQPGGYTWAARTKVAKPPRRKAKVSRRSAPTKRRSEPHRTPSRRGALRP